MKKQNLKRGHESIESDNFNPGKKASAGKDKSSKRKLSIYDEYEDVDDSYVPYEKFKGRRK